MKKGQIIDFMSVAERATMEDTPHFTLGKDSSNKWGLSIHWKYRGKPVWWMLTSEYKYSSALSRAYSHAKHFNLPLIKPYKFTLFKVYWAPGEDSPKHKTRRKFFFRDLNIELRKKRKKEKEEKNNPS